MPKTAKPTKPSPRPERKRRRGRPPDTGFKPTDQQRQIVEVGSGLGIRQDELVLMITNPDTGKPISPVTLRRHFAEQVRTGLVKAKFKGGANLLKLTEHNASAAIFWGKVKLGMRENRGGFDPDNPPQSAHITVSFVRPKK